jgi:hypothetical protein
MGLREFPDILLPVILQFSGHIADGSFVMIPVSFISPFDKRLYLHSRQGLVMAETF